MTNTLENKQKFAIQYWLQDVLVVSGNIRVVLSVKTLATLNSSSLLELKSLADIEDVDAEVIGKYRYTNPQKMTYSQIGKSVISDFLVRATKGLFELELFEIDYLRSKSYLLPFLDATTEDIINFGWAVIKQTNSK